MKYDDVSELMIKREHNILIVGNSASHIDKFFKGYSIRGLRPNRTRSYAKFIFWAEEVSKENEGFVYSSRQCQ